MSVRNKCCTVSHEQSASPTWFSKLGSWIESTDLEFRPYSEILVKHGIQDAVPQIPFHYLGQQNSAPQAPNRNVERQYPLHTAVLVGSSRACTQVRYIKCMDEACLHTN